MTSTPVVKAVDGCAVMVVVVVAAWTPTITSAVISLPEVGGRSTLWEGTSGTPRAPTVAGLVVEPALQISCQTPIPVH